MNTKTKKNKIINNKNKTSKYSYLTTSEKELLCQTNTLGYTSFEHIYSKKYDSNKLIQFISEQNSHKKTELIKNNFYNYVNDYWIKNYKNTGLNVNVNINYETTHEYVIYSQVLIIYYDFIKNNTQQLKSTKKRLMNFFNSAKKLNSNDSIKAHSQNILSEINKLRKDTINNNLWKLLAMLNKNKIIASQGCPLYYNNKPNGMNTTVYSVYIDPLIFEKNKIVYMDDNTNNEIKLIYKQKFIEYCNKLFVFFLGNEHNINIEGIFDILKQIFMCYHTRTTLVNDVNNYNKVFPSEAIEKYNFNYNEFFKQLGYMDDNIPNFFITPDLNYLKNVCDLMMNDWKSENWKGFWYYIIFKSMSKYNIESRKIERDFELTFNRGIKRGKDPEIRAILYTLIPFNKLFTELYIDKYANTDAKQIITNMTNDLKVVFNNRILGSTLHSENAKKNALLCIKHLKIIVGIPLTLSEDYDINFSDNDIWSNFNEYYKFKHNTELMMNNTNLINMPVVDWTSDPYEFIGGEQVFQPFVTFSQVINTLYVPLCCIQQPYFDLDGRGIEYNIANLGFLIAQKMYDSIGYSGSKYDYNGNSNVWWDKNDYKIYEDFSENIQKQYELMARRDNIKVDTTHIIDEIISMINGISICQSYLNDFHRKQNLRYIIIKQKNIEFYIFITYLFKQQIINMGFLDKYISVSIIINEYAINCALSRLKYFQEIYGIKQTDYMYYKIKDIL